jgi:eukaryotic-like serine/threonine-protein kinase
MNVPSQLKTALSDRYAIEHEIGAGGMATVYLARDLKHNRKVALKVLRPELAAVLGVERFLSEIEVTANLQHPHLLPLFDSGEAGGLLFYVMPYIEGESLRDRLERERQLPVSEAIRIAVAVCSALDYAHRRGVIHRDLKPENILLHDGQPMVTDFGIALAITNAGGARVTQTGLSLGTPQYMSPEQATGDRVIDARSDIYSLAAVLYELLTGDPPHAASTVQAIIAKVLTDKPQHVRHLRESVPEHVDAALMCALSKLPADRFATAGEFAESLQGTRAVPVSAPAASRTIGGAANTWKRKLPAFAAGMVAMIALFLAVATLNDEQTPPRSPILFTVEFSDSVRMTYAGRFAISPDGSQLAFVGRGPSGTGIYLRRFDSFTTRFVPGSTPPAPIRFSPDGTSLLLAGADLRIIPATGGTPVTLADSATPGQASWSDRGEIVYAAVPNALYRVPAAGGEPVKIPIADTTALYGFPNVLPGGKHALITIRKGLARSSPLARVRALDQSELGVVRLSDGRVRELGIRGLEPHYVNGTIVFARADRTLHAARFSLRRLKLLTEPVKVLDGVNVTPSGSVDIAISGDGSLIYTSDAANPIRHLVKVDRAGKPETILEHHSMQFPRIQPGGRRVALEIPWSRGRYDVWTYDLGTSALTRITFDSISARPDWSYDGSRITHVKTLGRWVAHAQPWDGSGAAETLFKHDTLSVLNISIGPPHTWSVISAGTANSLRLDLYISPSDSPQVLRPFLVTGTLERRARVSPTGRLVAYESDESGRNEIYVRTLPGPGQRIQVSTSGGTEPVWSASGELFYRSPTHIMAAIVSEKPTLDRGRVDTLFPDPYTRNEQQWGYDVFPGGKEFLFMRNPDQIQPTVLYGVSNWLDNALARNR